MTDKRSLTIVRLDAAKRAHLAQRNGIAYEQQRLYSERSLTDALVAIRIARERREGI